MVGGNGHRSRPNRVYAPVGADRMQDEAFRLLTGCAHSRSGRFCAQNGAVRLQTGCAIAQNQRRVRNRTPPDRPRNPPLCNSRHPFRKLLLPISECAQPPGGRERPRRRRTRARRVSFRTWCSRSRGGSGSLPASVSHRPLRSIICVNPPCLEDVGRMRGADQVFRAQPVLTSLRADAPPQ